MTSGAPNFKELLSVRLDEIKEPKRLPAGTYHGVITAFEIDNKNRNNTPYVRFTYALRSAGEDISPEDVEGIDLSTRKLTSDFYLTPEAMWRLRAFMLSLGFEEGALLDEILPQAIGNSVVLYVELQPNRQDPSAPPRLNVRNVKGDA